MRENSKRHTNIRKHNQRLQIDILRRVEQAGIRQRDSDVLSLRPVYGVALGTVSES
jgi:hypothetical protein